MQLIWRRSEVLVNRGCFVTALAFFVLSTFFWSTQSRADDQGFDFFIRFSDCKVLAASLKPGGPDVGVLPGYTSVFSCRRSSRKVHCKIEFTEDDTKDASPSSVDLNIDLDVANFLALESVNNGDYLNINPTVGTAALVTRIVIDGGLAAKVCRGRYLTRDEMVAMQRSEPAKDSPGKVKPNK